MTEKQKKYLRVILWTHLGGVLAVPIFLLIAYLTRTWGIFRLGECYYRLLLHIYCPGCGGTRAIKALVSFDLWEAFVLCPNLFIVAAAILWVDLWFLLSVITKREKLLRIGTPRIFWGVLAAVLIVAAIRTILAYTIGYDPLGDLTISASFVASDPFSFLFNI